MKNWSPTAPSPLFWVALFLLGFVNKFHGIMIDFLAAEGIEVPFARTWIGRDFTNLWVGSKMALDDLNIYDLAVYQAGLSAAGIEQGQNFSYPPATLLVGTPLSFVPYPIALAIWVTLGLVAFYFAARPFIRFHPAWLLLLPGLLTRNGQWGVFAAALFLWSFRGSGLAAGLLTLKPHLGLLLALTMAVKGRWRQTAVAIVTCVLLWGAAELAFGLTHAFLTDGVRVQQIVLTTPTDQPYFGGMPSAYVRLRGYGFAGAAHLIVVVAALALLWQARDRPMKHLAFPVATATFLVLPYGFSYDMAVVSLGFAILIYQRWSTFRIWHRVVVVFCYLSPTLTSWPIIPLILLAGLYIQVRFDDDDPEPVPQAAGAT
jgi:hypothetical protein